MQAERGATPYARRGRLDPNRAGRHPRRRDTAQLRLPRRGQLAKIPFVRAMPLPMPP